MKYIYIYMSIYIRINSSLRPPLKHPGSAYANSRIKAKSSLSGRNYFITMYHQAGVNLEHFTEVKFWDSLLTGIGHRGRRLNRDSPGQTGTYGRSNLYQNLETKSNLRFIRERPSAFPSFHQKCPPRKVPPWGIAPPFRGPATQLGVFLLNFVSKSFHKIFFVPKFSYPVKHCK